jgi:hypothetical protein
MRAYNALQLQALGRGTIWGISNKAVILIKHVIPEVVPCSFLEVTPAASFWQRILRSLSRSSKPTLQEHAIWSLSCAAKNQNEWFLILGFGFGFDDAVLYDKAGASVIRRQCTGGTHTVVSKHTNSVNLRFDILKGICFPFRVPCTYVAHLLINGMSMKQGKTHKSNSLI